MKDQGISEECFDWYEAGWRDAEEKLSAEFRDRLEVERTKIMQDDARVAAVNETLGATCKEASQWQRECIRLRKAKRCWEHATWALVVICAILAAKVWL